MENCDLFSHTMACVLTLSTLLLYVKCSIAISQDIYLNKANTLYTVHDDAGCHMEGDIFICVDIPTKVPSSITNVEVTGYKGHTFSNRFFDPTWKQVTRLHLTAIYMNTVGNNSFAELCLLELVLVFPLVRKLDSNAFSGLEQLEKLDLIGMQFVDTKALPIFIPGVVPKLKYATFNPGIVDHPSLLQLSDASLDEALKRQLHSINISNVLVQCEIYNTLVRFAVAGIDVLNVSGSTFIPVPTSELRLQGLSWTRPAFKILDFSRMLIPYNFNFTQTFTGSTNKYIDSLVMSKYLLMIENYYANYIYKQDTAMIDPFNVEHLPSFLKSFHFRGNNILTINSTWTLNLNNTLNFIDLSENKIIYITPNFCSTFTNLKTVLLSRNRLYLMQHLKEFGELLKPMRDLRLIDMSSNKLSYIPYNMFSTNDNIDTINLGFNELNTITFRLDNLQSLVRLDLPSNHIINIDGGELLRLRSFIDLKLNITGHTHLKFNLQANPIACTCKSVSFIKLLSYISSLNNSLNEYDCQYDGENLHIDNAAVEKSKYLCTWSKLIYRVRLAGAFSFVSIVVAIAVYVGLRKEWKESYLEEKFYARFKQRELTESYLVFMAYSSDDNEIVKNHLIKPFQEILSARIKTDAKVIATGDDFTPGHSITQEVDIFLKLSCVLLAVVSENFCSSEYCVGEIEEAVNQKKPIIMLFTEHVDTRNMTPCMLKIFNRKARADMSFGENGSVEFIPKLEKICDSVISLAVKGTK